MGIIAKADQLARAAALLSTWPTRRWVVAALGTVAAALATGIPTGIVHTSFYTRMTPVLWWNYPIWAVSAVLFGLLSATYVRLGTTNQSSPRAGRLLSGPLLSTFAIGCPICNKLVVAAIGVTGALNYWAPLQPLLGVMSVALLLTGLVLRLRGQESCPVPQP